MPHTHTHTHTHTHIHTYAHTTHHTPHTHTRTRTDVSGTKSVTLYYREDADGVNPVSDFANEVFEPAALGMAGVGAWQPQVMVQRVFPKGNVYNETVDFTCNSSLKPCLPTIIADEYFVQITGLSDVLIDYYIEAIDNNVRGGGGGGGVDGAVAGAGAQRPAFVLTASWRPLRVAP